MDNRITTNSPNFGMALFAPTTKKVVRVLGEEAAGEFEKVRPILKEIAKDVDIFVKPDKAWLESENPACNGFMMLAGKFKSNLDARLQMAKMFFLPYKPDNGYAWVSLKDMSVVGENLVAKANKIITEV